MQRVKIIFNGHFDSLIGIDSSLNVEIVGMENSSEFWGVFFEDKPDMEIDKLEEEAVNVALELTARESIGALVIECSTLPPFAPAIQKVTKLPVFDFTTLTHLMHEVVCRRIFAEHSD